jgi:hypothetical protein
MNRTLLPAIVIVQALTAAQVLAGGIALDCTLKTGNRLPLDIGRHEVTKSGLPLKNLDQKSVSIGPRYITFKQAFGTFENAWRINRATLTMNFKTVLQPAARTVIDERGSCAGTRTIIQQARAKTGTRFRTMIISMLH